MGKPHPKRRPREGWEEQFRKMHALGDDRLIEMPPPSAWDECEWEWDAPLLPPTSRTPIARVDVDVWR
jgi:hypothetical protein